MRLLDRLPIHREPTVIGVQGDVLQVWSNQIIVWLSIADTLRPFPAVLDTGHSHNFAITRRQFERWCGVSLKQIGESKVRTETIPQYKADVRIHRNRPGRHELTGASFPLKMDQGISMVPDDSHVAQRLPLLGLRSILHNNLRLLIDGERRQVTLKTGWF
jgi:hypothetical protein